MSDLKPVQISPPGYGHINPNSYGKLSFFGFFGRFFRSAKSYLVGGRYHREVINFQNAFDYYNMHPTLASIVDRAADTISAFKIDEINKNGNVKENSEIVNFLENQQNLPKILEYSTKCLMLGGNAFIVAFGNIDYMPNSLKIYPYRYYSYGYHSDKQHHIFLNTPTGEKYDFILDETTGRWLNGNFMELIVMTNGVSETDGVLGVSPQQSIVAKLAISVKGDDAHVTERLTGISTKTVMTIENRMSDEARNEFRKDISNMNSGADNAGNMMLINGGGKKIDIKELGHSKRDMEAFNIERASDQALYTRYGVPLSLYNENSATFNNMTTGHIVYYQDVILPLYRLIVSGFNLCFKYRKGLKSFYKLVPNKKFTNVLYETALGEAGKIQMEAGIWTRNQVIKRIDGGEGIDGGDVIYSLHNQPRVVAGKNKEAINEAMEMQQFQNIKQPLTTETLAPKGVEETPASAKSTTKTINPNQQNLNKS